MAEFGHVGIIGGGVCIDSWGAGPFVIGHEGKSWRFEDSDRFGPHLVRKDGEIAARQPGERSPFWDAHRAWVFQGRRLADDKMTCIFRLPAPETR